MQGYVYDEHGLPDTVGSNRIRYTDYISMSKYSKRGVPWRLFVRHTVCNTPYLSRHSYTTKTYTTMPPKAAIKFWLRADAKPSILHNANVVDVAEGTTRRKPSVTRRV